MEFDINEQLARTGARLGIVEPLLRRMIGVHRNLSSLAEDARARKDYETSDALRTQITVIKDALDYAFPRWDD